MRTSSGLGSGTTVGFFLHLGQLLSTCVPSLLVASMDAWSECAVNWDAEPGTSERPLKVSTGASVLLLSHPKSAFHVSGNRPMFVSSRIQQISKWEDDKNIP
ncbi:hypothetical protein R6Z07F_015504 [Ovis aries]